MTKHSNPNFEAFKASLKDRILSVMADGAPEGFNTWPGFELSKSIGTTTIPKHYEEPEGPLQYNLMGKI